MSHLRLFLLCLWASIFAGCRSTDPSVDLLESELRWLEDRMYLMDEELEQKCAELDSCRRNHASLIQVNSHPPSRRTDSITNQEDDRESANRSAPDSFHPRQPEDAFNELTIPELSPPVIEEGIPADAEESDSENGALDESEFLPAIPDFGRSQSTCPPDQVDARVTRIKMDSRLTGGYDFDGRPGDEGLLIVIEPRNASGQYVPLPGPLSITVHDTTIMSGTRSRLAGWNFNAAEVSSVMRRSLIGRGIHLELPWPMEPPTNGEVRIDARYVTPEGNELTSSRLVRVDTIANALSAMKNSAADESRLSPLTSRKSSSSVGRPQWKPLRTDTESSIVTNARPTRLRWVSPSNKGQSSKSMAHPTVTPSQLPQLTGPSVWYPYR